MIVERLTNTVCDAPKDKQCDAPKESEGKLEACPSHETGFTVQTKHVTLFLTVTSQNTPCKNWVQDTSCGNIRSL